MRLIRRLYDWVLHWAETPYGGPALFLLALIESSIFPVPPDVLLIALCISLPTRAWRFALLASVGSVLGGLLGLWNRLGRLAFGQWIFLSIYPRFHPDVFSRVQSSPRMFFPESRACLPNTASGWFLPPGLHPSPTRSLPSDPVFFRLILWFF